VEKIRRDFNAATKKWWAKTAINCSGIFAKEEIIMGL